MCIYHVGYARRLTHLRCSRLFGFQLAAMIHARVFEASDVGNDFIAPGIRKLRNRIICLIHSTSVATATRSQRVSIPTLKSFHMAPGSIP